MWLSGSKQGWQPRGRWFKLSWGQSLFVGGNVRLGYVRLGGRDWVGTASFFFSSFFFNIKKKKKIGSMCKLLDHTKQLLDARK